MQKQTVLVGLGSFGLGYMSCYRKWVTHGLHSGKFGRDEWKLPEGCTKVWEKNDLTTWGFEAECGVCHDITVAMSNPTMIDLEDCPLIPIIIESPRFYRPVDVQPVKR